MRFDVTFANVGLLRFGREQLFYGEGVVHLLETGLSIEGDVLAFCLPLMGFALSSVHQLLCNYTTRTLPYALVGAYRPPRRRLSGFWGPTHEIYASKSALGASPQMDLTWVGFRVPGRDHSARFSSTLQDYLRATSRPNAAAPAVRRFP